MTAIYTGPGPQSVQADSAPDGSGVSGVAWPVSDSTPATPAPPSSWWRRLVRGKSTDPAWVRLSVIALLVVTAVLYLWDLGASGYANSFYSAAVQAGTESWKAFFFGSSDAANFITVDKPPASLWVMGLSARIFGVNSWSILVPQALEGVAAVGLLYLTVRRWFSPAAGLIAGAVFALTPVAVLMFRFNNPDALLVLLLVAAAYAVTRAIEKASPKWLMLAGLLIGTGFLTKMMQAYVVVPAFALAYLIAAAAPFWKRVLHLLAAGVAMFVASAWWVAIVTFWPASDRPYIGGSQNNSILDLIFGYNGFGRITGNETGSVVPGGGAGGAAGGVGGAGSAWGATGIDRMFNSSYGGQISWLLPAALILLVALLVYTFRAKRTDKVRAAVIIWGGWLLLTGLTFSFMSGIIHEYYTVALAPAIGALVGIGVVELWKKRESALARGVLALTLAATSVWAFVLLGRSDTFLPWLRIAIVAVGLVLAGVMFFWPWMRARTVLVLGIAGLLVAMAGPTAYAIDTVATPHQGSIVTAGPVTAGARGGPGGGGPGGLAGRPGGFPGGTTTGQTVPNGTTGGTGAFPGGPGGIPGTQGGTGGAGGAGGLLTSSTSSAEMTAALQANASNYTWAAAAIGSQTASGYQLASGEPVMAIGGFNGSDPTPTLAQFQQYVASGQIHYFIAGGGGPGGGGPGGGQTGGNSTSSQISTWVAANYKSQTIGGTTVYDLTQPVTGGTA